MVSGKNLKAQQGGKTQYLGTPQGGKYYLQHSVARRKGKASEGFDSWVEAQLTKDTLTKLRQTPDYTQKECTAEDVVLAYIKHQPVSFQGHVHLTNWFVSYDITNGNHLRPSKGGKAQYLGKAQGRKSYSTWYHRKSHEKITASFEEWVLAQVSDKTQRAYQQARLSHDR